jgi:3-oxoacyl-[acyl-carrier protein] reductase
VTASLVDVGTVVVGAESAAAQQIAAGLTDRGARVAVMTEATEQAFADAEAEVGAIGLVVWARVAGSAGAACPLADTDPDTWAEIAERPLFELLGCLQAARRRLRGGGRIVVVVPSFALTGSPGRSAWATAAEGHRTLVKLAARAWGHDGITVNCIAVDGGLLVNDATDMGRPGMPALTLRQPTLRTEVAGVIASLAGDDAAAITGATVAVDGGVWMHP